MRTKEDTLGRASLRIPGRDYSAPGLYFVTMCTQNRATAFGSLAENSVILSPLGTTAEACLLQLPIAIPSVEIDTYSILPDHVHLLLSIISTGGPSLSRIVLRYKVAVSLAARCGKTLWQRGFYDHIVRNDEDMYQCREYISTNAIRHYIEQREKAEFKQFLRSRSTQM